MMTELAATPTTMLAEAGEAPARLRELMATDADVLAALGRRLRERPPPFVVTIARGSSNHAATYAAYLIQQRLGCVTASLPPSLWTRARARLHLDGALALAISQSGQGPDIIETTGMARERGSLTLTIVNDPNSPLAHVAEFTLPCRAGPERAVAATKSVLATLVVIARLVAAWSGDKSLAEALRDLPDAVARAQEVDWSGMLIDLLSDATGAFVVSRGPGQAIAAELALKLQELAGLHATGISSAELQHGPKALLSPSHPALSLPSQHWIGEELDDIVNKRLALPFSLHPDLDPILYLAAAHRAIAALARARGHDPDAPHGLSKVTRTL